MFGPRSAQYAFAVGCMLLSACASNPRTPARSEIDASVARFVAGDFRGAARGFSDVLDGDLSDAERREAYYYLGRSYMELGQAEEALDAFSMGVRYGDDGASLEFARQLQGERDLSLATLRRLPNFSRRQLASILCAVFASPGDADIDPAVCATSRGWIPLLPDGEFHGQARVTRAAFAVTMARVAAAVMPGEPAPALDFRSLQVQDGAGAARALAQLRDRRPGGGP